MTPEVQQGNLVTESPQEGNLASLAPEESRSSEIYKKRRAKYKGRLSITVDRKKLQELQEAYPRITNKVELVDYAISFMLDKKPRVETQVVFLDSKYAL